MLIKKLAIGPLTHLYGSRKRVFKRVPINKPVCSRIGPDNNNVISRLSNSDLRCEFKVCDCRVFYTCLRINHKLPQKEYIYVFSGFLL